MRRNGCPALVRMQTKECHTTKGTNTRTSQETSNLSVDMEEESSDMDNVNDRYTLCTEEAEEQPTSAADDLHLEDRNVNVMENADAYQETEVVLDSDYDDLAFDCTGCSTPEGSKTDRDCDQFGITMSPGLWLDQYHNLAPKEGNDEYDGKSQQYNHVCSCVVSPCTSPA
ncbi:hypothetical protein EMCRGX_G012738 [Ephydatia muelleri]